MKKVDTKTLLDDLKRLYILLGKSPTAQEIEKHGKYSCMTHHRHFGSVKKARQKAGLPPIKYAKYPAAKATDEQLLNDLKRIKAVLHAIPNYHDIKIFGKYSKYMYMKRFGSLKKALEKAGIPAYTR